MKTCHICNKTAAEVSAYEDYKNNNNEIHLCFKCLALVHYCGACNKLVTHTVDYKGTLICSTCAASNKLIICNYCNKLQSKALNEHGACKECAPKLQLCTHCNQYHLEEKMHNIKGREDKLCSKCVGELRYVFCTYCKEYMPAKAFNVPTNCCKECLSKLSICCICNKPILPRADHTVAYKVAPDKYACVSCCTHSSCNTCNTLAGGGKYSERNIKLNLGDDVGTIHLCFNCFITNNYGIIKRYGYKPEGKFKESSGAEYPNLFLGVENEVYFPGSYNPQERVRTIFDKDEIHWYIKRDGSLSNGFEIVTHPMHFEYIKGQDFPLNDLFKDDFGIKKAGECGMHIHLSKDAFTNAHLFKFMQFFINEPGYCERIAERGSNSYCSKLGKSEVVEKALKKSGGARNQINLGNNQTVEVRIFAGAIKPTQYLKNVEFVYALYCFTKKFSIINLNKASFEDFILKDRVKYENLISFLGL